MEAAEVSPSFFVKGSKEGGHAAVSDFVTDVVRALIDSFLAFGAKVIGHVKVRCDPPRLLFR